jgi:hypothetical protein
VAGNLNPRNLEGRPIPLRIAHSGAYCWLKLVARLFFDHRGWLTVHSSSYQIRTGTAAEARETGAHSVASASVCPLHTVAELWLGRCAVASGKEYRR